MSLFSIETELITLFMNKQETNDKLIQQKELENFKNKLEEYKNIIESKNINYINNRKKICISDDNWLEITSKK
jgi:hypothetical protein